MTRTYWSLLHAMTIHGVILLNIGSSFLSDVNVHGSENMNRFECDCRCSQATKCNAFDMVMVRANGVRI